MFFNFDMETQFLHLYDDENKTRENPKDASLVTYKKLKC